MDRGNQMSTPYQNIFGRFSVKIQDYTLDDLFNSSIEAYESYLLGFLKSAIPKFSNCKANLLDRDDTLKTFNVKLSEREEEILATLMQAEWADKETNNVLEMRLGLSNSDFKRYAEANNLKAKMELRDSLIERADKMIVEYTYQHFDFK